MSVLGSGDQQNTQTQPFTAFSFGATTSSVQPTNLTSQASSTGLLGTTTTSFGGLPGAATTTSSIFGAPQTTPAFSSSLFPSATTTTNSAFPALGQTSTAPAGGFNFSGTTTTPFGGLSGASTTTSSVFGTTQTAPAFSSSLFPSATTTSSAFPTLGQTSTTPAGGFNFGGGSTFGTNSLVPSSVAISSAPTTTIGLGGVDIQASSGLDGANTSNKKDGKATKELQIPNEIAVTVESFKKYVKQQKAIREEMSRVSSKNIFKVQELVVTLKQQLSIVSNGLHRNAIAIAKLKEESNQELKHAEIAQRTKDALTSMQYENNAPTEYFHNLASSFEKQMQSYRQQIEQLERHLLSLSQPYTLTPNEWTAIRKRLHDTFVTLAAQLQTIHQEVQLYKEHFLNNQRINQDDMRLFLEKYKENMKGSVPNTYLPACVTYGPSPFAAMQSDIGKAISSVFNRSQQFSGSASQHMMLSLNSTRISSFQNLSTFKPLGK